MFARKDSDPRHVLEKRANGGWRVRSVDGFTDMYPGISTKKARETDWKAFQRGG
jgi:hypothetical protein